MVSCLSHISYGFRDTWPLVPCAALFWLQDPCCCQALPACQSGFALSGLAPILQCFATSGPVPIPHYP